MNSGTHPVVSETEAQVYKSSMWRSHPQKKNDAKGCWGPFRPRLFIPACSRQLWRSKDFGATPDICQILGDLQLKTLCTLNLLVIQMHNSAATEKLILIKLWRKEILRVQWVQHAVDSWLVCFPVSPSYSPNRILSTSLPDFSGLIYDSGGTFVWSVKQWFLQMKNNIDNAVSCLLYKTDFPDVLEECCEHESHIWQDLLVPLEHVPSWLCHYSILLAA